MRKWRERVRGLIERRLNALWYGSGDPPLLLRGMSRLYRLALGRRWHRPAARPPIPVIVVGNLTAGGTGKTPVVIALARHLAGLGQPVAVISRGYGAAAARVVIRVDADSDPARSGDEPVLIARRAQVPVYVARRRDAALARAVAEGARIVISDDGLQHARLARSLELCVVDGQRGLGNGWLLPAGPLRQPVERLEAVDQVLIKGAGWTRPGGLQFELVPEALQRLDGGRSRPPEALSGQAVDALCAIANPRAFAATLEQLGMQTRLHAFPDHHAFRVDDLRGLAGPIVTTAKDAVKLERLSTGQAIDVLHVGARLPDPVIGQVERHVREFADGE